MNEIDYNNIIQKLPYKSSLVSEVNQNGFSNNYIKIILSVKDLSFSNWFHFTEKERLMAESDSKQIVTIGNYKYLKTYRVIENTSSKEHEKNYGRIILNINKRLYPDGLHYYVRKVYPRPKFLPSMYGVNFSRLDWIDNEVTNALISINKSIETSRIHFSHYVENEHLVLRIKIMPQK